MEKNVEIPLKLVGISREADESSTWWLCFSCKKKAHTLTSAWRDKTPSDLSCQAKCVPLVRLIPLYPDLQRRYYSCFLSSIFVPNEKKIVRWEVLWLPLGRRWFEKSKVIWDQFCVLSRTEMLCFIFLTPEAVDLLKVSGSQRDWRFRKENLKYIDSGSPHLMIKQWMNSWLSSYSFYFM